MQQWSWIFAAFFLPLFPLSIMFNVVFQRLKNAWVRVFILLIWPLPGVWILRDITTPIPDGIVYWALFSAALYAFRAVVVKEFGIWIGFLATSSWATNWIAFVNGVQGDERLLHALAFSFPLALLILLVAELESRYESAYVGVVSGLSHAQPRLAGILVVAMLAVIGSPMFPAFFSILDTITHAVVALPLIAVGVVIVWLLWSWSGMRLLQELLVGPILQTQQSADMSRGLTIIYGVSLVILIIAGLIVSRVLL